MSVVGISFGSATSGTGFDVDNTITAIMAIQRQPETAWKARVTALQAQDTALSTLGTDISTLSTALGTLTAFDGALSQKSGASSDTTVLALTSADNTARAGTHSVTVTQLAQTATQYSSVIAATDTLSGTFSIAVGSGTATSITLDSSNNTLASLASYINTSSPGVTASIVTDNSGSRLSLISNTSGSAGVITTGGSLTSSSGTISFTTGQAGRDATFSVDGLSMTSSSNTVNGAIPGVTFQLLSAGSNIQVEIANDISSVTTSLNTFVTAYNALLADLKTQEGNDSTGAAEPLFGSQVISQIQTTLASALGTGSSSSGSISYLTQLGITTGTDGTLSLDSATLNTALSTNFSDVQSFFQTKGNFGQNLTTSLLGLGSTTSTGTIAQALSSNSDEESRLTLNTTNLEARLVNYQAALTTSLNSANQILQAIPQQLDEVKQIYAAITGYGNNT